ncbi:MAG: FecR domain-containing protein [Verrucomicrobia bacterium]|nr:FecR domain-containing protein [Verrucomicrobiota bacterium]
MSRNVIPFPSGPGPHDAAAARWLARRDAGLTPAEQAEFVAWLAADPAHEAAWHAVDAAWRAFDTPRDHGLADGMVLALASRRRQRRQKRTFVLWSAGLAAAACLAVVFLLRPAPTPPPLAVAPTPSHPVSPISSTAPAPVAPPVAQPADPTLALVIKAPRQTLEDGTVVELNGDAEIAVHYMAEKRSVRLIRGEALFTVAKNPARPFIVSTGLADVQAVGTAFAVKLGAQNVDVLVTEGRVAVDRTAPAASAPREFSTLVDAGNLFVMPRSAAPGEKLGRLEPLAPAEVNRRTVWRAPRLELSATPLRDAVTALNRENTVRLRLSDPALAELRLSGVFRADDAEGFARSLQSYGVQAERRGDEIVLSRR